MAHNLNLLACHATRYVGVFFGDVCGTVVSTRAFHLCDPGSTPAHRMSEECFQFDSTKHRRFSPGTPVSSSTNTGPMRDGTYWTSRENSLVMTDRVIQYK